jgi:hypothetical protein
MQRARAVSCTRPTGMGKTYAAAIRTDRARARAARPDATAPVARVAHAVARARERYRRLRLARRRRPESGHWTVDVRTGDTSSSARARRPRDCPRPRHHAGEPHAHAVAPGLARALRASRGGGRRRVARAHGQQARRADRARIGAAARTACRRLRSWGLSARSPTSTRRWNASSGRTRDARAHALVRGIDQDDRDRERTARRRSSDFRGPGISAFACCRR